MVPLFELKIRGLDNLKAFSASLHFLRIVGKDLQIEVSPDNLVLRALNDAKTAYASVEFAQGFFERGTFKLHQQALVDAYGGGQAGERDSFSCKLPVKHLCSLTKSFVKNVNELSLYAKASSGSQGEGGYDLIMELHTAGGIKRTHRFKYSDCDVISAVFEEVGACSLRSQAKVLTQVLEHMHHAPEVILSATTNTFKVQSYHRASAIGLGETSRHLETDLNVDVGDFDFYDFEGSGVSDQDNERGGGDDIGGVTRREVIVSKREWRAILQFCENLGCEEVSLLFINQGRPIKLELQHDFLVGTLIMTTLEPKNVNVNVPVGNASVGSSQQPSQQMQSQAQQYSSQRQSQALSQSHQTAARSQSTAKSSTVASSSSSLASKVKATTSLPSSSSVTKSSGSVNNEMGYRSQALSDSQRQQEQRQEQEPERSDENEMSMSVERSRVHRNRKDIQNKSISSTPASRKGVILDEEGDDEDEDENRDGKYSNNCTPQEKEVRKFRRLSKTGDAAMALIGLKKSEVESGNGNATPNFRVSTGTSKSTSKSKSSSRPLSSKRSMYDTDESD